jgi:hypothetical protein
MKKVKNFLINHSSYILIMFFILSLMLNFKVSGSLAFIVNIIYGIILLYLSYNFNKSKEKNKGKIIGLYFLYYVCLLIFIADYQVATIYFLSGYFILRKIYSVIKNKTKRAIYLGLTTMVEVSLIILFFVFSIIGAFLSNATEEAYSCNKGIVTTTGYVYNPGATGDYQYNITKGVKLIDIDKYLTVEYIFSSEVIDDCDAFMKQSCSGNSNFVCW